MEGNRKQERPRTARPLPSAAPAPVPIRTEWIKLQDFLKLAGAVETGGEAKADIQGGKAQVNGETCLQRGKKLRPGDCVRFRGKAYAVGQAAQAGAEHAHRQEQRHAH